MNINAIRHSYIEEHIMHIIYVYGIIDVYEKDDCREE